jgi:hypothetical protein
MCPACLLSPAVRSESADRATGPDEVRVSDTIQTRVILVTATSRGIIRSAVTRCLVFLSSSPLALLLPICHKQIGKTL